VRTVNRVAPQPLVNSVTIAGSMQSELGCPADWDPACAATHLTFEPVEPTGVWRATFRLPEGSYEYKVAINDSWTVSYGAGGGGNNITLTVPVGGADVTFTWDQMSHIATHTVEP
jgi:alpha-amylase